MRILNPHFIIIVDENCGIQFRDPAPFLNYQNHILLTTLLQIFSAFDTALIKLIGDKNEPKTS